MTRRDFLSSLGRLGLGLGSWILASGLPRVEKAFASEQQNVSQDVFVKPERLKIFYYGNLRLGPSLNAPVLRRGKGAAAIIGVDSSGEWYYVRIAEETGDGFAQVYIHKSITTGSPPSGDRIPSLSTLPPPVVRFPDMVVNAPGVLLPEKVGGQIYSLSCEEAAASMVLQWLENLYDGIAVSREMVEKFLSVYIPRSYSPETGFVGNIAGSQTISEIVRVVNDGTGYFGRYGYGIHPSGMERVLKALISDGMLPTLQVNSVYHDDFNSYSGHLEKLLAEGFVVQTWGTSISSLSVLHSGQGDFFVAGEHSVAILGYRRTSRGLEFLVYDPLPAGQGKIEWRSVPISNSNVFGYPLLWLDVPKIKISPEVLRVVSYTPQIYASKLPALEFFKNSPGNHYKYLSDRDLNYLVPTLLRIEELGEPALNSFFFDTVEGVLDSLKSLSDEEYAVAWFWSRLFHRVVPQVENLGVSNIFEIILSEENSFTPEERTIFLQASSRLFEKLVLDFLYTPYESTNIWLESVGKILTLFKDGIEFYRDFKSKTLQELRSKNGGVSFIDEVVERSLLSSAIFGFSGLTPFELYVDYLLVRTKYPDLYPPEYSKLPDYKEFLSSVYRDIIDVEGLGQVFYHLTDSSNKLPLFPHLDTRVLLYIESQKQRYEHVRAGRRYRIQ